VVAWVLPSAVALALNSEFGTSFVGRDDSEIDATVRVDRDRQRRAIACHPSQATGNAVLRRRLELLGDSEHLRVLRKARQPAVSEWTAHDGAYPVRWEMDAVLADGGTVHVRPIRASDGPALTAFHGRLSPETVYLRFFGAMPRLSPDAVHRFTHVDWSSISHWRRAA